VFAGHGAELSAMRRWLATLLPGCQARDDLLVVATELGTNAIQHTATGRGGWFAVEVTWHGPLMQVVVADCGGPDEPRMIDDPAGECGRGLRLVHGLSMRTGYTGDQHGRLVWAQIAWPADGSGVTGQCPVGAVCGRGPVTVAGGWRAGF
jgi:hypothetical protein